MGFRVVTEVGEKRVGRIVGSQGDYYIVKRSFGRARYPLPKRQAVVESEKRRVLMRVPRKRSLRRPKWDTKASSTPQRMGTTAADATAEGAPRDSPTQAGRLPRARRTGA
jgi:hypothetical protein